MQKNGLKVNREHKKNALKVVLNGYSVYVFALS